MLTATTVPLSEYLDTSYRPDREYIDGEVRERNSDESDHSRMQALLIGYLLNRKTRWGITVMPEQPEQVRSDRYRVPEICVVAGPLPTTRILDTPPFLCIEVLSRGDSMYDMQDRIGDYLTFGVPYLRVVNPRTRRAFLYTPDGMREAKDGILLRTQNPDIEVPVAPLE